MLRVVESSERERQRSGEEIYIEREIKGRERERELAGTNL